MGGYPSFSVAVIKRNLRRKGFASAYRLYIPSAREAYAGARGWTLKQKLWHNAIYWLVPLAYLATSLLQSTARDSTAHSRVDLHTSVTNKKQCSHQTGEMDRCLRSFAALAEGLSVVANMPAEAHNHLEFQFQGIQPFPPALQAPGAHMWRSYVIHRHSCIYIK